MRASSSLSLEPGSYADEQLESACLLALGSRITPEVLQREWNAIAGFEKTTHPADVTQSMGPIMQNVSAGPSKVYLAPIVDKNGNYALRVFAVCFDSATIYVYDPEGGVLEQVIRVGLGPFAMTFDPFNLDDVAQHKPVPIDQAHNPNEKEIRHYRFGYIASFTQSYVQLIDLDNAVPATNTFEQIVFTLGKPTNPKGT